MAVAIVADQDTNAVPILEQVSLGLGIALTGQVSTALVEDALSRLTGQNAAIDGQLAGVLAAAGAYEQTLIKRFGATAAFATISRCCCSVTARGCARMIILALRCAAARSSGLSEESPACAPSRAASMTRSLSSVLLIAFAMSSESQIGTLTPPSCWA